MPLSGILCALMTVFLWGGNFVAAKIAVTDVPPLFVTGMRFVLLTVLLSPFMRRRIDDKRAFLTYALIIGIGHFCLMFVSIQFVDITTLGIVLQMGTPFIVLLAWVMLGEKFGVWRFIGIASAFGGVIVLVGFPSADTPVVWLLVLVVAAFMWALSGIRAKQLIAVPPFTLIAWTACLMIPVTFALSFLFESGQVEAVRAAEARFWYSLAYMTVGSSIGGYGLWYYLLQRYDVTAVAPYNLLVPLIVMVLGVNFMGDELTAVKLTGGAMILGGVALITVRQMMRARRARILAAEREPGV